MKYILLDTSILMNCSLLNVAGANPDLLATIVDKIRLQGARLLVPEVIRLEYEKKVSQGLKSIKQQTKKFRDGVNTSVLPSPDVANIHEFLQRMDRDRDAAAQRAQDYIKDVFLDGTITVTTPLDGTIIAKAVSYALAGIKPSNIEGHGLINSDSLIIASVAEFVRMHGLGEDDLILICSDNHTDFATYDKDSHKHVIAESIDSIIPCPVSYYKSLKQLLEEELDVDVNADQPLNTALEAVTRLQELWNAKNMEHLSGLALPLLKDLHKNQGWLNAALSSFSTSANFEALRNVTLGSIADFSATEAFKKSMMMPLSFDTGTQPNETVDAETDEVQDGDGSRYDEELDEEPEQEPSPDS